MPPPAACLPLGSNSPRYAAEQCNKPLKAIPSTSRGAAAAGAALSARLSASAIARRSCSAAGPTARRCGPPIPQSGRDVVVKLLPARLVSPGVRMRLEHDAAASAALVQSVGEPLLDMAWAGDRLCLVRQFVPGESLRRASARGPLDLADTLTVGRCLLSALNEMHRLRHHAPRRSPRPRHPRRGVPLGRPRCWSTAIWRGSRRADASVDEQSLESARYRSPEQTGSLDFEVGRSGRSVFGGRACSSSALPVVRRSRATAWARSSCST